MPDRPPKTQKTTKGYEIQVPTLKEVYDALAEIFQDPKPPPQAKKREPRK